MLDTSVQDKGEISKYPCPCCGYVTLQDGPGGYDICPICFWEDDLSQLRFPTGTGANKVSLIEAQNNFEAFGACERRLIEHVRKPTEEDRRAPGWRKLNANVDKIEVPEPGRDYGTSYPENSTELYYWRHR